MGFYITDTHGVWVWVWVWVWVFRRERVALLVTAKTLTGITDAVVIMHRYINNTDMIKSDIT